MNKIRFFSADKLINICKRNKVKGLIQKLFLKEEKRLEELSIIFCSDKFLLEINKKYLNHNYYTDVITFFYSPLDKPVKGEIYISVDRIKENAKLLYIPYQSEMLRVIIHGVLHLCGYEDKSKQLKNKMQVKEDYYIKLFKDSRET